MAHQGTNTTQFADTISQRVQTPSAAATGVGAANVQLGANFGNLTATRGATGGAAGIDQLISARLGGLDGNGGGLGALLPGLDAQSIADIEAVTTANRGNADQVFGDQRDQLLRDLFGRGVQRSSIAGDAGGRLLSGREQALRAIVADEAARRQGLRQQLFTNNLGQSGLISQSLLQNADINARENVGLAGVDAQNNSTSAQLRIGALNDQTRRDLGFGDLDFRNLSLGFSGEQGALDRENQLAIAKLQANAGKTGLFGKILAGFGAAVPLLSKLPFFSTKAVKENIVAFDEEALALGVIQNTQLYKFNYVWDDESKQKFGIVLESAPDLFTAENGVELDMYQTVMLLMAAVKELSRQVESLKETE